MANILVVDDDEVHRYIVVIALLAKRHSVREAENGKQALDLFKLTRPHLVITDIEMPVQNGLLLISEIRKDLALLPIVAMTGGSTEKLVQARLLGADVCMSKPVRAAALQNAVDTLIAPM